MYAERNNIVGSQIGTSAIAPQSSGLLAIDRLSETCKRLHQLTVRAEQAADAINGSVPSQAGDTKSETPTITVSSLCGSLDSLTAYLESQIDRICIGLGC